MELDIIRTLPQWQAMGRRGTICWKGASWPVPFLRHEFLSAWWRHLGGGGEWPRAELYVVLAREAGSLVAAAPLMSSVDREGNPVLAWIGSVRRGDYLDLLALPEALPRSSTAFGSPCRPRGAGLAIIELRNLLETSPTPAELGRAAAARACPWRKS